MPRSMVGHFSRLCFTIGTPHQRQCHLTTDVWLRPVPSFTLEESSFLSVGRQGVMPESGRRDLHPYQTKSSALWLGALCTGFHRDLRFNESHSIPPSGCPAFQTYSLLLRFLSLKLPCICLHISVITAEHQLLIQSLFHILFVSYLLGN